MIKPSDFKERELTQEQLNSKRYYTLNITEAIHLQVKQFAKENDCSMPAAYTALIRMGLNAAQRK